MRTELHTLSKSFLFKVSNSVLPEREIREIFKNIFISVRAYRSNIFCPTYTGDLTTHYLIFFTAVMMNSSNSINQFTPKTSLMKNMELTFFNSALDFRGVQTENLCLRALFASIQMMSMFCTSIYPR